MWRFWIRRLHDSDSNSCELAIYRDGERPGWDCIYVNTYWTKAEAKTWGERIASQIAPGATVDCGYGVMLHC